MSGEPIIEGLETITEFERAGEYIMLGLRTTMGICKKEYQEIYHGGFDRIAEKLDYYARHGLAVKTDDRWCFTPRGFLVSNILIAEVLDAQTKQRSEAASQWRIAESETDGQTSLFEEEHDSAQWFRGM